MSEERTTLADAVAEELREEHGLDPDAAARAAAEMAPSLRGRFATWVRRELALRRRVERRRARRQRRTGEAIVDSGRVFTRFSLSLRFQHGIMAISVLILIFTGLPLKFHERAWAQALVGLLGGPEVTPIIHRVGAALLIFVGLWHLAYVVFTRDGRSNFMLVLPRPKDAVDAFKQVRYYLGRSDERPRFDRFSYVEKFDYWAVYWGMVIMISTGIALWFTEFFLRYFPKWTTDIAKEAHSDEALLATLAIVIWHFYNVHLNPHKFPMNKTFLTGTISEREMIEEHPLEYERLMEQERAAAATEREEPAPSSSDPPHRRESAR